MRVVLDTNVYIAAFATEGACMRLFHHCAKSHHLVTSVPLLEELREKLARKLRYGEAEVADALRLVLARADVVNSRPLPTPVCRDPDDDHVLGTALAGGCRCIVTGDRDLLVLGSY